MEETKALAVPLVNKLVDAGFAVAAGLVEHRTELRPKVMKAGEMYRYITDKRLKEINALLKSATTKKSAQLHSSQYAYLKLEGYNLRDFPEVPPADVIQKLEEAKALDVFSTFNIIRLETAWEEGRSLSQRFSDRFDPILLGRIEGLRGVSFILAQWGEDIEVDDLIGALEG